MIRAIIVYLFLYHTGCLESYRILGVFPSKSRSHFLITGTIMKSLASRGHEVFVVSYFPQSSPTARYKDVIIPADTIPEMSTVSVGTVARNSPIPSLRELYTWGVYSCEATFNAPQVQELLASEASFDLVMVEVFNADCLFAFAHRFQAPLVGVSTGILLPWASDVFGNPDNPSYIPAHFFPYPVRMSFWQRLVNAVSLVLFKAVHKTVFSREADRMARKYLGENVPSVEEIARTMSLQLVNTHLSLHQPRPMVPAVVEVGGLHLREPTNISKELGDFLDESEEGVIYFSLGSRVRSDSFPEEMRQGFLEAFSELPQRVLWKWESDYMPAKPGNVKILKWMPQLEILSHSKVKVFITHGGSMGTMEAAYYGVPMVAIPLFGDQPLNARYYVDKGIAVVIDYATINKETILSALKTVLYNESYAANAKRVAKLFRDRPLSPLDTAVYWTEYVIRHKGAQHLRLTAVDLPWHQYVLLDVVVFIAVVSTAGLLATVLLIRKCVTIFKCKIRNTSQENNHNKIKNT